MTHDLRRLRAHGLITRIPRTHRYEITDTGLQQAQLFTHAHDHLLRTGLAEITDPAPPPPSPLTTPDPRPPPPPPIPPTHRRPRLPARLPRPRPLRPPRGLNPNPELDSRPHN